MIWSFGGNDSLECIYRHALPPGFILKKDRKNMEDLKKATEISLEELIEKEVRNSTAFPAEYRFVFDCVA